MVSLEIITDPFLRSVLEVSALTHDQCLSFFQLVEEHPVAAPTQRPSWQVQARLAQQRKILNAYLAQLRGLNREAILRVRQAKQATAEARQEVDRLHLQLQNLYYEQNHLRGELAACEAYEYVVSFSLFAFFFFYPHLSLGDIYAEND
jgi:THO complex subunit 5